MILKMAGSNASNLVLGTRLVFKESYAKEHAEIFEIFMQIIGLTFPKYSLPEDYS